MNPFVLMCCLQLVLIQSYSRSSVRSQISLRSYNQFSKHNHIAFAPSRVDVIKGRCFALSMSEGAATEGGSDEGEEEGDTSGQGFGKKVDTRGIRTEEQLQLRKTETRKVPKIEFKSVGTAVENSENDPSSSRNIYMVRVCVYM